MFWAINFFFQSMATINQTTNVFWATPKFFWANKNKIWSFELVTKFFWSPIVSTKSDKNLTTKFFQSPSLKT